ncbi:MAG: response regulator [Oligoflexia bacterium]|nr:response regulator [Oligoflexia bacterium]
MAKAKIPKSIQFLHLDDIESIREMMKAHLSELGFTYPPIEAASVAEVLKIIENYNNLPRKFEFIISDWNLGDDTGLTFLKKFREIEDFNKIPFLMVTTENDINFMLEAINFGCSNYMVKPWLKNDLEDKIESSWDMVFTPPASLKQKKITAITAVEVATKAMPAPTAAAEVKSESKPVAAVTTTNIIKASGVRKNIIKAEPSQIANTAATDTTSTSLPKEEIGSTTKVNVRRMPSRGGIVSAAKNSSAAKNKIEPQAKKTNPSFWDKILSIFK